MAMDTSWRECLFSFTVFSQLLASFAVGVGVHLALFRHGEWDRATIRICYTYFCLFIPVLLGSWMAFANMKGEGNLSASAMFSLRFLTSGAHALGLAVAHALGLFGSMAIYRLFFHRLAGFPGPFWARLTGFYMLRLSSRRWQLFKETQRLHQQYGDFVRVAPQSLSITHPDATRAIYAGNTVCVKGPFYDMALPRETIFMTRNKSFHSKHRKDWDRAFSATALRDYEPRVTRFAGKLVDVIASHAERELDVARWFNYFSFDVMGELAFGESFGRLDAGEDNMYMNVFHQLMDVMGLQSSVPWAMMLVEKIPSTVAHDFQVYSRGLVEKRRSMKLDKRDVFSYLLDSYEKEPVKTDQMTDTLYGDCDTIVVAGSDTTASALTALFYLLAKFPGHIQKLRAEFAALPAHAPRYDGRKLASLPYLNAVINEALRLFPPIASGVQRYTPPEGLRIGGTWIPGNVNVQVPSYTMFRDARCFDQPDDFVPDRWTDRPEMIKDVSVYVPFTSGKYACAGKQLALLELREVTTRIIDHFDFNFASPEEEDRFLAGRSDAFGVTYKQPVKLIFRPRKR